MDSQPLHPSLATVLDDMTAPLSASGATLISAEDGVPKYTAAVGVTKLWDRPGVPAAAPGLPVELDTRFDWASITKTVFAAALLVELEARGLTPAAPVADLLPEFHAREMSGIRVQHLLTHTAGFAGTWGDIMPDPGARRFREGARPAHEAPHVHGYSCVGFIWAGLYAEALSGLPLDELLGRNVLGPLGMSRTGYRPSREEWAAIPATEFQQHRGMVQGEVHDEVAYALGGVSANAGLFGSAPDLLRYAEALRTGAGFSDRVHSWLTSPVGAETADGYTPTMGLRSAEAWARIDGARTVGHAGFTGTAFFTEPGGHRSLVLLTNRVHPSREQLTMPQLRNELVHAAFESHEE